MNDNPANRRLARSGITRFSVLPFPNYTFFLAFCLLLLAGGCQQRVRDLNTPPRLTAKEALKIADSAAIEQGMILARIKSPTVDYNGHDKTWLIFYGGKVPSPGNNFSVIIEDATGDAVVRSRSIDFMPRHN